jgi:hypothetical protein
MRPRDARAIAFCVVTTLLLLVASFVLLRSFLISVAATGAYAALVLTRPRMIRVIRRLRGEPDWGGYFKND